MSKYNKRRRLREDNFDVVPDIIIPELEVPVEEVNFAETSEDSGITTTILSLITEANNSVQSYISFKETLKSISHQEDKYFDYFNIIDNIIKDELNHVGMLQALLKQTSPHAQSIETGEIEANQMIDDNYDIEGDFLMLGRNELDESLFESYFPLTDEELKEEVRYLVRTDIESFVDNIANTIHKDEYLYDTKWYDDSGQYQDEEQYLVEQLVDIIMKRLFARIDDFDYSDFSENVNRHSKRTAKKESINKRNRRRMFKESSKDLADRIRKGKLKHGNFLATDQNNPKKVADADKYDPDAGFEYDFDDDGLEVQIQDRQSNAYKFRGSKSNRYEAQPRVKSYSDGKIWRNGNFDKHFTGSKYGVRQDMAKYLDSMSESKRRKLNKLSLHERVKKSEEENDLFTQVNNELSPTKGFSIKKQSKLPDVSKAKRYDIDELGISYNGDICNVDVYAKTKDKLNFAYQIADAYGLKTKGPRFNGDYFVLSIVMPESLEL